jgi:branched-chain amino acid transport system ATP-binding protein
MLNVKDINVYYGEVHALRAISFSLQEGEIVAFLGANGHGKSTLLKSICGLLKPAGGRVEFMGRRIDHLPMHKIVELGVVYVPEEKHLFPDLTVEENLLLGAYNSRARKQKEENYQFVYNLFPRLNERRKQVASTLSGGERQMLALGRGLMSSAKLIAIDEPSVGLAPIIKKEVFAKIKEINQRQELTVIIVEQEVESTLAISDRGYIMKDGRIVHEDVSKNLSIDIIQKQYLA